MAGVIRWCGKGEYDPQYPNHKKYVMFAQLRTWLEKWRESAERRWWMSRHRRSSRPERQRCY